MRTGVAGIELEVTLSFHDDGTPSGMQAIAAEGVALPEHISTVLWRHLKDLKPADAVVEAAWEDASLSAGDDVDDAGVEEEREAS